MPTNIPYSRLTGTCLVYVAAALTAATDLDVVMPGAWTLLGPTDGGQNIQLTGALEYFYADDAMGPVKSVRPQAGVTVKATLVNMVPEQMAYAIGMAATDVVDHDTGLGMSVRLIPLGRDFATNEFAMTIRGGAEPVTNVDSPYGAFPAQIYIPRGVFDSEPEIVRTKDGNPGLEFTFTAQWDYAAAAGRELGYFEAQDV